MFIKIILCFCLVVVSTATASGVTFGIVTYVYDGDTIMVDHEKVRLLGVDTPEVVHKKYGKPGACFGEEAKSYLTKRLLDKKVRLVDDRKSQKYDKYKRRLAYVYLAGRLINEELIREGYGRLIWDFPFAKRERFLKVQNKAIIKRKGYWGKCIPTLR